jgi:hypothetical protein
MMAFQTSHTTSGVIAYAPHPTSSSQLGALFRSNSLILMPTCCTQYAGSCGVVAVKLWFHGTCRESETVRERGSAGHELIIIDSSGIAVVESALTPTGAHRPVFQYPEAGGIRHHNQNGSIKHYGIDIRSENWAGHLDPGVGISLSPRLHASLRRT